MVSQALNAGRTLQKVVVCRPQMNGLDRWFLLLGICNVLIILSRAFTISNTNNRQLERPVLRQILYRSDTPFRLATTNNKKRFATIDSSSVRTTTPQTLEERKFELVTLGATLDRGQAYNPTSGEYYKDRIEYAKERIDDFIRTYPVG